MRNRTALQALMLVAASLSTAGCQELLGPVLGTRLELDGPRVAYGTPAELLGVIDTERYECEYVLFVEASHVASMDERPEGTRWAGGVLTTYDAADRQMERIALTRREAERTFHDRYRPGDRRDSRPFRVEADSLPFRWSLSLTYFDPQSGDTRTADFTSRCVALESE